MWAKRAVSISDPFVELKTKRSGWMRDPSLFGWHKRSWLRI